MSHNKRCAWVMNRRNFLKCSSLAAAGSALSGCATNPVTGKSQFMLYTEADEVGLDQKHAPQMFSADFGPSQEDKLNRYVSDVSFTMVPLTHRPQMPYNFRVVNAPYANAYIFPGGSSAITRGLLVEMESEAELAAVMGHELGHVNARHTSVRMSTALLTNIVAAGLTAYVASEHEDYEWVAAGATALGSTLLLAKYSRDDERQADALGIEYMVAAGYDPAGMVELFDILRSLKEHEPSIIDRMFSSHPMDDERYDTACQTVRQNYASDKRLKLYRERFMDHTRVLREIKEAVQHQQKGMKLSGKGRIQEAKAEYSTALGMAPDDYAGLMLMALCCQQLKQLDEARQYVVRAREVYPEEAQSYQLEGTLALQAGNFGTAHQSFITYKRLLPGDPTTSFYNALALDGMDRSQAAAEEYYVFLQAVQQGGQASYAYQRLVDMGYIQQ